MIEILDKRTQYTKSYALSKDTFELRASILPMHYEDNGVLKDFDLSVKGDTVNGTVYEAHLLPNEFGYFIKDKNDKGGVYLKLKDIAGVTPVFSSPVINENKAVWNQIVNGIDFSIEFTNFSVKTWITISDSAAPHEFTWEMTKEKESGKTDIRGVSTGRDADNNFLKLSRTIINETIEGVTTFKETFDGFCSDRNPRTRVPITKPAVYPVTLDPSVDVKVSASGDDGRGARRFLGPASVSNGNFFNNTQTAVRIFNTKHQSVTALQQVYEPMNGFIRFLGITIPQFAIINSATLKVFAFKAKNGPKVRAVAKKLNNPAAPATFAQVTNPGTLATHTNLQTPSWVGSVPGTQVSFTVTGIVQELVNAFDYSNEAMLFFLKMDQIFVYYDKSFGVTAFDYGNSARYENLIVTYSTARGSKMMMMGVG